MQRNQISFWFLFGVFALTGCTRPLIEDKKNGSSVSFSFPQTLQGVSGFSNKLSAMVSATAKLVHVSINVTGNGIGAPIILTWDACHDCPAASAAPATFELNVPSGESRLVQVMTVYQDSSTDEMVFRYGDTVATISGDSATVAVNMEDLNAGSVTKGRISGRYLNTASDGPTGRVDVLYRPAGKPAMVVLESQIVDGWFSFFMLSGIQFEYVVRGSGQLLWNQAVDLNSSRVSPTATINKYRKKLYVPKHLRMKTYPTTVYVVENTEQYIWGYYSDTESLLTNKRVCHDTTTAVTNIFRFGPVAGPYNLLTPIIDNAPSPVFSIPTYAQLTDETTPYYYYAFFGGYTYSGSVCDTASAQWTDLMNVTRSNYDGNGNDSIPGFSGIFIRGANGPATVTMSSYASISGSVLPGISTNYPKVRAYKRTLAATGPGDNIENPDCTRLSSLGFTSAASDSTISSSSYSFSTNISSSDGLSGVEVVLCPVDAANNVSAVGGVHLPASYFGYNPTAPVSIGISAYNPSSVALSVATNGTCILLKAMLYDAASNLSTNPSARMIRLTTSGGGGVPVNNFKFYPTQTECDNDVNAYTQGSTWVDLPFAASITTANYYVRADIAVVSASPVFFDINANTSSSPMSLATPAATVGVTYNKPQVTVTNIPTPTYGICNTAQFSLDDTINSLPVKLSSSLSGLTLASTGTVTLTFFANSTDCTNNSPQLTGSFFPSMSSTSSIYFKGSSTGNAILTINNAGSNFIVPTPNNPLTF